MLLGGAMYGGIFKKCCHPFFFSYYKALPNYDEGMAWIPPKSSVDGRDPVFNNPPFPWQASTHQLFLGVPEDLHLGDLLECNRKGCVYASHIANENPPVEILGRI